MNNGSISRLCRWMATTVRRELDAERVHDELRESLESLDPRTLATYYRLNITLADALPRMDDVESMQRLSESAMHGMDVNMLSEIIRVLAASSFFFELDEAPVYGHRGEYVCKGAIRVRGRFARILTLLESVGPGRVQFCKHGEVLADMRGDDMLCVGCKRFNAPVKFLVRHPSEQISITLRFEGGHETCISAFPQHMDWFVEKQNLRMLASHTVNASDPCVCRCPRTTKAMTGRRLLAGHRRTAPLRCQPPRAKRMRGSYCIV